VRETEILVEQQPQQGVLVCDHAGLVINTFSSAHASTARKKKIDGSVCAMERGETSGDSQTGQTSSGSHTAAVHVTARNASRVRSCILLLLSLSVQLREVASDTGGAGDAATFEVSAVDYRSSSCPL